MYCIIIIIGCNDLLKGEQIQNKQQKTKHI